MYLTHCRFFNLMITSHLICGTLACAVILTLRFRPCKCLCRRMRKYTTNTWHQSAHWKLWDVTVISDLQWHQTGPNQQNARFAAHDAVYPDYPQEHQSQKRTRHNFGFAEDVLWVGRYKQTAVYCFLISLDYSFEVIATHWSAFSSYTHFLFPFRTS